MVFFGFSLDYFKDIVRHDGGKHICIDFPAVPHDTVIPLVVQHIMYSILFEPAAMIIDPLFCQCRHDVLYIQNIVVFILPVACNTFSNAMPRVSTGANAMTI